MIKTKLMIIAGALWFVTTSAQAEQCGPKQANLVELYTSQGCSSCPPAERWLNDYRTNKKLWKDYVPLAFHVDYWDYLGWRDIYANSAYSARQRYLSSLGNFNSVYTPGILVNGKEWKGFFGGVKRIPKSKSKPGILNLQQVDGTLKVTFEPAEAELTENTKIHIAWLANNIITSVQRGENAGKDLPQEFVVLQHADYLWPDNGKITRKIPGKLVDDLSPNAVAVWLGNDSEQPIQACGLDLM